MALRDLIRFLGPKWLTRERFTVGDEVVETDNRILSTIALLQDAQLDRAELGFEARLPGLAPPDALPYIGRDNSIFRGPNEPQAQYEARLIRAKDDLKKLGIAWGLLEQVRAYCTPHAVRVRIVNEHCNWYQIDRDGTRSRGKGLNWEWDGAPDDVWSRFWLQIYMVPGSPTKPWARLPPVGDPLLWDGEIGPGPYTVGSTATPDDVASIRSIVNFWRPEFGTCIKICVIFNDVAPAFEIGASSPPAPDGQWAYPSKNVGGVQVPSRSSDSIYWSAR